MSSGELKFDMMVLHLKSGAASPQADEVNALESFIKERQQAPDLRHLIVLGDWNIRPDQSTGRRRLRKLMVSTPSQNLMRVLTVEELGPSLDEWETFGNLNQNPAVAALVPFTHFNARSIDTFLDHIAISSTFEEIFDHPISVTTASGKVDLRPGVRIATPLIPEADFYRLTDHLPVVLTLRNTDGGAVPPTVAQLILVSAIPNPTGDDRANEQVTVRNVGSDPVPLAGWKILDDRNTFWALTAQDGIVDPGQTVTIIRGGRPMSLNNTGDTVRLVNPAGQTVDAHPYDQASSGQVFVFN